MFDPSLEQNVDPENVVNSRYFDIDEIETLKVHKKTKSLSLCIFLNGCSLNKVFDDLEYPLKCTNKSFDTIAVREPEFSRKLP